MNERELKRAAVCSRVAEKAWTLVEGAARMAVSYRQGKRLWKRYQAEGSAGLVHGNVGRASNRAKPEKLRHQVLGLIRKKYGGEPGQRFGPTLAVEHLAATCAEARPACAIRTWKGGGSFHSVFIRPKI